MTGFVIEWMDARPPREVIWVPFPERAREVLASAGLNVDEGEGPLVYWEAADRSTGSVIRVLDPGTGVRFVRDHEQPPGGPWAWRWFDPRRPRCWYCGIFTGRRWRHLIPPCPRCGEDPRWL